MASWRKSIIITIIVMIPFSLFILWYQDTYRNTTEDFQNLYFAIGAGITGTILHFLKNHKEVKLKKPAQIMIDSLQFLLLVITPTTASFTILKQQFPNDVYPLLILLGIVLSLWYFITLWITNKQENKIDGKATSVLTHFLYWSFIGMIVLGSAMSIMYK